MKFLHSKCCAFDFYRSSICYKSEQKKQKKPKTLRLKLPQNCFIDGVFKLKNETDYNTFLYQAQKNEQSQVKQQKAVLNLTEEDAAQAQSVWFSGKDVRVECKNCTSAI